MYSPSLQCSFLSKCFDHFLCLVILGNDCAGVISARTRIDVLTTSARCRLPFTHFLSLPIGSAAVQEKFDIFKEEVLQECAGVSQHQLLIILIYNFNCNLVICAKIN